MKISRQRALITKPRMAGVRFRFSENAWVYDATKSALIEKLMKLVSKGRAFAKREPATEPAIQ